MCGIVGFVGSNNTLTKEKLLKMNDSIVRRGPDSEGYYIDRNVGLAMRRLSILDLEGGQQPIYNEDRTVVTVFNGEIYNFRALREELETAGHEFYTHSDTEVIVHLYEEYGVNFVHHLRGMFAIALHDLKTKTTIIARDHLGIKPLFYSLNEGSLIFASEIKALRAIETDKPKINLQAIDAFLTLTYIPAPMTIFEGVLKLEPGHMLIIKDGNIQRKEYWDAEYASPVESALTENEWTKQFDDAIKESVSLHLESDVELGSFLSGGVDSGIVSSMMAKLTPNLKSFTIAFKGINSLIDERIYAKKIAQQHKLDYHDFEVEPDFKNIINEIVDAFDEPFADDSVIPTYHICQQTRRHVKVALSGLGGDELFAGYQRYLGLRLSSTYKKFPSYLRNLLKKIVTRIPEPKAGGNRLDQIKRFVLHSDLAEAKVYYGYIASISCAEKHALYDPEFLNNIDITHVENIVSRYFSKAEAAKSTLEKALYTDIKMYLPDDILALSDRLSMWHSLEVRVPLADYKLVEMSTKLPSNLKIKKSEKKYLLKKISERYLPKDVIYHKKQGFEAPMGAWLKNELNEFVDKTLSEDRVKKLGLLNYDEVWRLIEAHRKGVKKNNKILFSIIMLHLWADRHYLG